MSHMEEKLRFAAANGRLDDVTRLVEEENVNPNYDNGYALYTAALNGRTNVVNYLLTKNVSTEYRVLDGDTPLICAAYLNYLEVARLLLAANANINARNNDNKTALDLAVEKNRNEMAQLLRDHIQRKINNLLAALHERRIQDAIHLIKGPHTDVNLRDGNFVPLLHLVVDTGDMELLQTLLAKPHLDVNATDKDEQTALVRAMTKNDMAAVVALLKANARVALMSDEGLAVQIYGFGSLLLQAASTNNTSNVENLLRAGVRSSTSNEDGATALLVAAVNGYDTITSLLLAKDPSLSLHSDHRGNLPLHLAAAHGHLSIVDQLLVDSTNSGLDCTNNNGEVPLFVAAKAGYADIVERLLKSGASLDYTIKGGWTLLHVAAVHGNLDVIRILLSTELNVFAKTTAGETPLKIATDKQRADSIVQAFNDAEAAENQRFLDAARTGDVDCVNALLKKGASVNTKDATGCSALLAAVAENQVEIVKQLVHARATIDVNDEDGNTPLLLAARQGHAAVVDVLLKALAPETMAATIRTCYAEAVDLGHTKVANAFLPHLQTSAQDAPKAVNRDGLLAVLRIAFAGADLDAINKALVRAVLDGQDDLVLCLLELGADVWTMQPEQKGMTLLAVANKHGHDAVAQALYPHLYPGVAVAAADELRVESEIANNTMIVVNKGTYQGKSVVFKGPQFPNRRMITMIRTEADAMQEFASPYLQPLLAILDNASSQPHVLTPSVRLFSPTMIMEHMDQGDLHQYLQKKRYGLPVGIELSTIEVALVLAQALADLHGRNGIHRDIKSPNIFLSTTHYVRLGDLGSARTLSDTMTSNVGTKHWIAPEVLRAPGRGGDGRAYSSAADIYAFGVVLTELDTGDVPFAEMVDVSGVEELVQTGQLRPKMSANCPAWLQHLADKCLAFNPKARPTAATIVKELLLRRDGNGDGPSSIRLGEKVSTSAIMCSDLGLPTIIEDSVNGSRAA